MKYHFYGVVGTYTPVGDGAYEINLYTDQQQPPLVVKNLGINIVFDSITELCQDINVDIFLQFTITPSIDAVQP